MKVNDKDLDKVVRVYRLSGNRVAALQQLAAEARRKPLPPRVPDHAIKYVNLERAVTELKIFNGGCFPGTIQTADYARDARTLSDRLTG